MPCVIYLFSSLHNCLFVYLTVIATVGDVDGLLMARKQVVSAVNWKVEVRISDLRRWRASPAAILG